MSNKKYWKGFDELQNDSEFKKSKKEEFAEELPITTALKREETVPSGRRDFLKVLGYSLTAATVAASCEIPVRKAIPYVVKPEEILPGIANYYASSFVNGNDYCSVLVKTREGRPIKIEGNKLSKITKGGTSARAQASVVSLYDNARLKFPKAGGKRITWPDFDNAVSRELGAVNKDIVILTDSIISPSTKKAIQAFKNRYSRTRVVTYDAVSKSGMLYANEKSFGERAIPSYSFDKADVIVSVDCDFLGSWVSPIEFAVDYAKTRKVDIDNTRMSQHFQFEPRVSITGANADYRRSIKPSEVGAVMVALYGQIVGGGGSANLKPAVAETVKKAALALNSAKGKSILVCGSNDPDAQMLCNAINSHLGNYGNTIDFSKAYTGFQGDDVKMQELVTQMNNNQIGAILINNVNPAYSYPQADSFIKGLQNVSLSISFSDREDETSEFVKYLAPDNHYLESWNDVEFKKGQLSLVQPTIAPLFDTRQMPETLLALSGNNFAFGSFIEDNWKGRLGGVDAWNKALHDGVFEASTGGFDESPMGSGNTFTGSAASAVTSLTNKAKVGGVELCLYENNTIGDGKYANNAFLQETPDPIAKICWDNYAIVSPKTADKNGWTDGSLMRSPTKGSDIISVTANGKTVELPITIQPGLQEDVIAVAVGYGRTKPGNENCTVGKNVYPLLAASGSALDFNISNVTVQRAGGGYKMAQTQTHHTIDDEREIINETTLDAYKAKPNSGNYTGQKYSDEHWVDHHFVSLYPGHDESLNQGHHWGMSVDLNTCIGCAACVVACSVENNVPIVGQLQVHRAKEMHWMRIDRYYSSHPETDPDFEHPEIAFQPMMCQHCDNAPCENVCPVNASNHSSEGLNQMAYNRCIGTRYCANNCPYKVRRFNWFDYTGTDSFYGNSILSNDEFSMADNLSRMVLNPDVTVRSRGVMEKCTFCVQNLQTAKLEAKKAGRPMKDGEAKTACQTGCPTNAIEFGDLNDSESAIYKKFRDPRAYDLLADIHVLSSVKYLTMIRNKDEIEGKTEIKEYKPKHHGDHGGGHGDGHGGHDGHGGDSHGADHGKKGGGHGKKGHDNHGADHGKDDGHGH